MDDNTITTTGHLSKNLISESLLLAFLTIVGYMCAFGYQFSYLSYYNIPTYFIDLTIGKILLTIFIILFSTLILITISLIVIYLIKNKEIKVKKISLLTYTFVIGIVLSYTSISIFTGFKFKFQIFIISVIFSLLYSILFFKVYIRHILVIRNSIMAVSNKSEIGQILTMVIFLSIFAISLSFYLGFYTAAYKQEYLITNTTPQYAIISMYGESFLGIRYSTSTADFEKDIILINHDRITKDNILFTSSKIGPINIQLLR